MIRGALAFSWLWPTEPWRERARELRRSKQGAWQAAERLVERRITKKARDRFLRAVTDLVNDTLLPELAATLATSLPEDTTERRVLRAMARRDFFYAWLVSPTWRARCSYQQLCQSRTWVQRLVRGADPFAAPFAEHVCAVEEGIKARALRWIGERFNPALLDTIHTLAGELAGVPRADAEALITAHVFERLRSTVLETVVHDYDQLVR